MTAGSDKTRGKMTEAADMLQLAHRAAHDLRSPLNTLTNVAQLFARRYTDIVDVEGVQLLEMLEAAAREMRGLIDNLLAYADALAGGTSSEPADADKALAGAIAGLQKQISSSGADIRHADLPRIAVSSVALERIFQNLIGNAIAYRRAEASPEIRVSAKPENGSWLFAVSDNGVGIPAEYHQAIFEPFRKLDPDLSGSGLGLAIVKALVERHGGRVWVNSQPGTGSTFYFTLPGPA